MRPEGDVPKDPLAFIRDCVRERRILWTYHVNMRLQRRFIPSDAVLKSSETFEIVESYPEDKYLPSYLVYARFEGWVFHVLFATDVPGQNVRVVTVYRPDPEEWSADLKRRRSKS